MKIYGLTKAVVMTKPEPTKSKDGQNTYYKIGIVSGSECGMVSVSKDVYETAELGQPHNFETVYDTEYKNLRFNCIIPVSEPKK